MAGIRVRILVALEPKFHYVVTPTPARCFVLPNRIAVLPTSLLNNGSSSREKGTAPAAED